MFYELVKKYELASKQMGIANLLCIQEPISMFARHLKRAAFCIPDSIRYFNITKNPLPLLLQQLGRNWKRNWWTTIENVCVFVWGWCLPWTGSRQERELRRFFPQKMIMMQNNRTRRTRSLIHHAQSICVCVFFIIYFLHSFTDGQTGPGVHYQLGRAIN